MAVKILWYLTAPDGIYPWSPEGRWHTDFEHLQQLATTIDRLGYYGALLGTSSNESLVVASALIATTKRMKFLVAQHPGELSPAVLAKYAQTFDKFSNGRLLFNVVNGNDKGLASLGVHYPHDERYDFSREYWDAFQKVYAGDTSGYDGKFVKLSPRDEGGSPMGTWNGPTQNPHFPLWGAGTSPAGVAHSVELLDVYLSFPNTPPLLGDKFRRVDAEAAKIGRKLEHGTRFQIIVRETEEEAWEYAEWLLGKVPLERIRQSVQNLLPTDATLETFESDDLKIRRAIAALREGKRPSAKDLEVYPNVAIGPTWLGSHTLIGSAINVADRIREYEAQGTNAFIISAFPLISEAQRVADILLPLLDLDHGFEVPRLRVAEPA